MTRLRASFRRHWWLTLLLLLGANLARAAVPTGYMPSAGTDGSITVKLCSGSNWQIPVEKAHDPAERDRRPDHPCAFAGLAIGAALPPPPFIGAPLALIALATFAPHALVGERRAIERPRPPARAPPQSV